MRQMEDGGTRHIVHIVSKKFTPAEYLGRWTYKADRRRYSGSFDKISRLLAC
jgi:hypothetical protein